MDYVFYEKLYESEWQRSDRIQSAATTPVGVLSLLGGGLLVLTSHIDERTPLLYWLFWALLVVAGSGFVMTAYWLVRVYVGYEYLSVPLPSLLSGHLARLEEYHSQVGTPGLARSDFHNYLRDRYIEAGDRNAANNLNRTAYLYRAVAWLVFTLCASGVAAVPVAIHAGVTSPEPQPVTVVHLPEVHTMSAATPPLVGHPKKPEGPPNIVVRPGIRVP